MMKVYNKFKKIDVEPGEYLCGCEGISGELPDTIEVVEQYDDWLLVEMTFSKSDWGMTGERKIRRGFTKGAMLCGDVRLEKWDGTLLIGDEVGEWEYMHEKGVDVDDTSYAFAG